jgi:hypothetical protein
VANVFIGDPVAVGASCDRRLPQLHLDSIT